MKLKSFKKIVLLFVSFVVIIGGCCPSASAADFIITGAYNGDSSPYDFSHINHDWLIMYNGDLQNPTEAWVIKTNWFVNDVVAYNIFIYDILGINKFVMFYKATYPFSGGGGEAQFQHATISYSNNVGSLTLLGGADYNFVSSIRFGSELHLGNYYYGFISYGFYDYWKDCNAVFNCGKDLLGESSLSDYEYAQIDVDRSLLNNSHYYNVDSSSNKFNRTPNGERPTIHDPTPPSEPDNPTTTKPNYDDILNAGQDSPTVIYEDNQEMESDIGEMASMAESALDEFQNNPELLGGHGSFTDLFNYIWDSMPTQIILALATCLFIVIVAKVLGR